jgi:hypothetical protein
MARAVFIEIKLPFHSPEEESNSIKKYLKDLTCP